jgi:competence protein CoiA
MLCALRESGRGKVDASLTQRGEGSFVCPGCLAPVVLKKGKVRVHHFAHKSDTCTYSQGESETHRRAKRAIYDGLCGVPGIEKLELEHRLDGSIADIYFERGSTKVAVEVQLSVLSVETIKERTLRYHQQGVHVLWLPQFRPELYTAKYAPKGWERWLSLLYNDHVYYWKHGLTIVPVRFGEYKLVVPYREWYDEDGELQCGGGYKRTSKRWVAPHIKPSAPLTAFGPKYVQFYDPESGNGLEGLMKCSTCSVMSYSERSHAILDGVSGAQVSGGLDRER